MIKWLLVALVFGLALVLWRSVAFASSRLPKAGDDAPAFSLADQSGTLRSSGDFRGKWLALYFYPRDDTPGCTEQACAFRDDMRELEALGAQVVGVSVDDTASHAQFAQKFSLPFPLLADEKGEVAASYGSIRNLGIVKLARRNTFLIDPQGRIAKVYLSASAARNSQQIVNDLNRLRAT